MDFFNWHYWKNSKRLLNICGDLIEKYQKHEFKPSCKNDLLISIKEQLHEAKEEVSEWKDYDTDYIKIAHTLLANTTFELLASGRYHLYARILNPLSCAPNMMDVYNAWMEYGVSKNLLNEETRKEQYDYLLECINSI